MGSTFSLPYAHINQSLNHQALSISTPKPLSYFSCFVPFTTTSLVIKTPTTLPTLYQSFRYARFWAKYLHIFASLNPPTNNPVGAVLLLAPFYR